MRLSRLQVCDSALHHLYIALPTTQSQVPCPQPVCDPLYYPPDPSLWDRHTGVCHKQEKQTVKWPLIPLPHTSPVRSGPWSQPQEVSTSPLCCPQARTSGERGPFSSSPRSISQQAVPSTFQRVQAPRPCHNPTDTILVPLPSTPPPPRRAVALPGPAHPMPRTQPGGPVKMQGVSPLWWPRNSSGQRGLVSSERHGPLRQPCSVCSHPLSSSGSGFQLLKSMSGQ